MINKIGLKRLPVKAIGAKIDLYCQDDSGLGGRHFGFNEDPICSSGGVNKNY